MLSWLANEKQHWPIQLLYSVRGEDEIIFQDTFERAGMHTTIIVERPTNAWGGERGRIIPEQIISLTNPTDKHRIYLSEPEPMVETLSKGLHAASIPKRQFVTDFFPGYLDQ